MNFDLIKQYIFVSIRWFTPMFAGWLVTKTGITNDAATAWIGTTVTIGTYAVMILWSLANKTHYENKVNTALDLPKGSDKETLKEVLGKGQGSGALAEK